MSKNLDVLDLYADANDGVLNKFNEKMTSNMDVSIESNKPKVEMEWLDLIEFTIPYINNILDAPKKLIINEEEVVNIEKIRKVTVESIKHLSSHSNLIADVTDKGDIQPDKLLNVFKEETFNTYENRFIFTLIQKMLILLKREKERLQKFDSKYHEYKKVDYTAKSSLAKNNIELALSMTSTTDNTGRTEEQEEELDRIKVLEKKVLSLTMTEVYLSLQKSRVPLVKPPLSKTNVLLKNVNFQYAVRLWDFLIDEMEKKKEIEIENHKKNYKDKGKARNMFNETFLLNALVMETVDNPNFKIKHDKEVIEKLIANVVERTIDIDTHISEEMLKNLISKQYRIIKYKATTNNKEIQDIFKKYISKYVQKITRYEKEG